MSSQLKKAWSEYLHLLSQFLLHLFLHPFLCPWRLAYVVCISALPGPLDFYWIWCKPAGYFSQKKVTLLLRGFCTQSLWLQVTNVNSWSLQPASEICSILWGFPTAWPHICQSSFCKRLHLSKWLFLLFPAWLLTDTNFKKAFSSMISKHQFGKSSGLATSESPGDLF